MIPGALKQLAELNLLGAKPRVDMQLRDTWWSKRKTCPSARRTERQIVKGPPLSAGRTMPPAGFAQTPIGAGRKPRSQAPGPGNRTLDILSETIPARILAVRMAQRPCTGPSENRPANFLRYPLARRAVV